MIHLKLKGGLIAVFGSQAAASQALGITERRLSRLIRGFERPNARERKILQEFGGVEFESAAKTPNAA